MRWSNRVYGEVRDQILVGCGVGSAISIRYSFLATAVPPTRLQLLLIMHQASFEPGGGTNTAVATSYSIIT